MVVKGDGAFQASGQEVSEASSTGRRVDDENIKTFISID